jgi:hypothetical protein
MIKPKTIPNNKHNILTPDFIFLITVPNHWGKGATVQEAKRQVKNAGGKISGPWRLYAVHKDSYVNEFGQIAFPTAHGEPQMLEEYDPQ